ncbi:serine/threonine protein kinase [Longispora fulva]|uniref:Serine/threonine protein kinase n=1 Tax=Longispora fulva TaxID=619741 RepID=A0A8J7GUE7_9ACTN|nr:serine/threonine protein kinase [Longispora fulva]
MKVIKSGRVADAQFRERFELEVESLRMAHGARIARFEGADVMADPPWLAVEYVPGITLSQHVELHGTFGVALCAILGAALAEGLDKIHLVGLLHRDLKPGNILLGPDGPKLIDFGLSSLVERDERLTEPGMIVGTLAYMPPEQAQGLPQLGAAADVYSLGATLVYALTGRSLYPHAGVLAVLRRITDPGDRPDLSGVPAQLLPLMTAMLAFDPVGRPSVPMVASQLLEIATSGGESAEALRHRLERETYSERGRVTVLPILEDPDVEDELESLPPRDIAAGRRTRTAPQPATDIDWLVERLRAQYAHHAAL